MTWPQKSSIARSTDVLSLTKKLNHSMSRSSGWYRSGICDATSSGLPTKCVRLRVG
jgi:hypothetical protein